MVKKDMGWVHLSTPTLPLPCGASVPHRGVPVYPLLLRRLPSIPRHRRLALPGKARAASAATGLFLQQCLPTRWRAAARRPQRFGGTAATVGVVARNGQYGVEARGGQPRRRGSQQRRRAVVCSREDLAADLHVEYGLRSDLIWPERHARCIAVEIGGGSVHMKLDGGFKQIWVKNLPEARCQGRRWRRSSTSFSS